jgi:eukaryotic-like serine/threonine-protein kinase
LNAAVDLVWLAAQFPNLSNLAQLGVGGQKLVLTATHPADGNVVLKLIHPAQPPDVAAREIQAVQAVNSPRVPRIFETGTLATSMGTVVWVREQRVVGLTVRELLAGGPLAPQLLLRLGLHTLEVLAAAEAQRIVHRDVKPENIISTTLNDFWLIDFGIARHLDLPALTDPAQRWGKMTAGYAPPEQFRNVQPEIDGRSDLFALGVTLHECATGTNPFRDGTGDPLEMLRRTETRPLPRLNLTMPGATDFADFVSSLVQRRRDHRPRTATEALLWIQEICAK